MSRIGDLVGRLLPNDRELAESKYADRQSASDRSRRRDFKPGKDVTDAARQGQAWEDEGRPFKSEGKPPRR